MMTVIYDQVTSRILEVLSDATRKLRPTERSVTINKLYALRFATFDEACRTLPQLAAGFDDRR